MEIALMIIGIITIIIALIPSHNLRINIEQQNAKISKLKAELEERERRRVLAETLMEKIAEANLYIAEQSKLGLPYKLDGYGEVWWEEVKAIMATYEHSAVWIMIVEIEKSLEEKVFGVSRFVIYLLTPEKRVSDE